MPSSRASTTTSQMLGSDAAASATTSSGAGSVGGEQLADRRVAGGHQRRIVHDEHQVRPRTVHPAEPGRRATREGRRPPSPVGHRSRDRGRAAASAASPAPASPGAVTAATRRSAGPWATASWRTRLRASGRATAGGPTTPTTAPGPRLDGDRHVVEHSRRLDERPPLVGHRVAARLQRRRLPAITAAHDGGERTRVVAPGAPRAPDPPLGHTPRPPGAPVPRPAGPPRRPPGGTRDRRRRPRSRRRARSPSARRRARRRSRGHSAVASVPSAPIELRMRNVGWCSSSETTAPPARVTTIAAPAGDGGAGGGDTAAGNRTARDGQWGRVRGGGRWRATVQPADPRPSRPTSRRAVARPGGCSTAASTTSTASTSSVELPIVSGWPGGRTSVRRPPAHRPGSAAGSTGPSP